MTNMPTNQKLQPKFPLGQTVATPAALEVIEQSGQSPAEFLDRHCRGDYGEVCEEDQQANDDALKDGSRLLSAYRTLKDVKIWVITEAVNDQGRRAATTILLPDEY